MKTLKSNIKELRNKSGIYKFIFPTGKVYIGQSIDLYSRINQHIWQSKQPLSLQIKLYSAIKNYGLENIQLEVLWSTERPIDTSALTINLDKLEKEYIEKYDSFKNGYNSTLGGKGAEGLIVSEESRVASKERSTKPSRKELIELIYEYGLEDTAWILHTEIESLEKVLDKNDYSSCISTFEKRNNSAIKKSQENKFVNELMTKNYDYLSKRCIKKDLDFDHFNDTFLKMTGSYNVDENFISEFIHQFNISKMQLSLDKRVIDNSFHSIDLHPEAEDIFDEEVDLKEVDIKPKKQLFSNSFINNIKTNANTKKSSQANKSLQ